jgi:hypothetical protein
VAGLAPGEVRPLTAEEVGTVQSVATGTPVPEPALFLPPRRHGRGGDEAEEGTEGPAAAPGSRDRRPRFGAPGRPDRTAHRGRVIDRPGEKRRYHGAEPASPDRPRFRPGRGWGGGQNIGRGRAAHGSEDRSGGGQSKRQFAPSQRGGAAHPGGAFERGIGRRGTSSELGPLGTGRRHRGARGFAPRGEQVPSEWFGRARGAGDAPRGTFGKGHGPSRAGWRKPGPVGGRRGGAAGLREPNLNLSPERGEGGRRFAGGGRPPRPGPSSREQAPSDRRRSPGRPDRDSSGRTLFSRPGQGRRFSHRSGGEPRSGRRGPPGGGRGRRPGRSPPGGGRGGTHPGSGRPHHPRR